MTSNPSEWYNTSGIISKVPIACSANAGTLFPILWQYLFQFMCIYKKIIKRNGNISSAFC